MILTLCNRETRKTCLTWVCMALKQLYQHVSEMWWFHVYILFRFVSCSHVHHTWLSHMKSTYMGPRGLVLRLFFRYIKKWIYMYFFLFLFIWHYINDWRSSIHLELHGKKKKKQSGVEEEFNPTRTVWDLEIIIKQRNHFCLCIGISGL